MEAEQPQPQFLAAQTREPVNTTMAPEACDVEHAAGTDEVHPAQHEFRAQAAIAAALSTVRAMQARDAPEPNLANVTSGHLLLPVDSTGDSLNLDTPLRQRQQQHQLLDVATEDTLHQESPLVMRQQQHQLLGATTEGKASAVDVPLVRPLLGTTQPAQHLQAEAAEALDIAAPCSTRPVLADVAAGQYATQQQPQICGPSAAVRSHYSSVRLPKPKTMTQLVM